MAFKRLWSHHWSPESGLKGEFPWFCFFFHMRTMGLFPLETTARLCSQGWKKHFLDSHADDIWIFDIPTRRNIRNILRFFKNYSISSILVQHHKLTKTGKTGFSFLIIKIAGEECLFKYKRFFSKHHVEAITKFATCWETVICFINRAGQRCWCVDLLFMRHIQTYLDHQSF